MGLAIVPVREALVEYLSEHVEYHKHNMGVPYSSGIVYRLPFAEMIVEWVEPFHRWEFHPQTPKMSESGNL